MTRTEELNQLFEEWEAKKHEDGTNVFKSKGEVGQFIRDGIVCEEKYEESSIKVLFILKDTNDANPEIFYDRGVCDEVLESNNSGSTWNRVAEWARALTIGNSDFVHADNLKKEEAVENEKDGLRKYFKKVAIMNLKKASGGAAASGIEFFANMDRKEILEEIFCCEPDIIVTCGTFEILKKNVITSYENVGCMDLLLGKKMVIKVNIDGRNILVFEYRHPAQGCSAEKSYKDMLKIREYIL